MRVITARGETSIKYRLFGGFKNRTDTRIKNKNTTLVPSLVLTCMLKTRKQLKEKVVLHFATTWENGHR